MCYGDHCPGSTPFYHPCAICYSLLDLLIQNSKGFRCLDHNPPACRAIGQTPCQLHIVVLPYPLHRRIYVPGLELQSLKYLLNPGAFPLNLLLFEVTQLQESIAVGSNSLPP